MKKLTIWLFNRETLLYLFFGILTTIVSFGSFVLFKYLLGDHLYLLANIFSFILAVVFAFITNKLFVFSNKCWTLGNIIREFISFIAVRILSFLCIEELGLWIASELLHAETLRLFSWDGILLAKLLLTFLVVIVNYVFSKFFIFVNKESS